MDALKEMLLSHSNHAQYWIYPADSIPQKIGAATLNCPNNILDGSSPNYIPLQL
jgi:hypothetical protein